MIKIPYDEGRFFIEDEELCYSYDGTLEDYCSVQDLTEMRVWEYNSLVDELNNASDPYIEASKKNLKKTEDERNKNEFT